MMALPATGVHSLTVAYGGDTNHAPGVALASALEVTKTRTTNTLTAPLAATVYGQAAIFTVTVQSDLFRPAHSTTGVASRACSHCDHVTCASGGSPSRAPSASIQWFTSNGSISLIAMNSRGNASAAATLKRRVMSISSGLSPVVADGVSGSSAMPQIGQLPGPCCRISGCIGHV